MLDAETRRSAGTSALPRTLPLGVFLAGVGVQGVALTGLVGLVG